MLLALCHHANNKLSLIYNHLNVSSRHFLHKFFLVFWLTVLSLLVAAEAQAYLTPTICNVELKQIQSAKGVGEEGKGRPLAQQWQNLDRVPDYWNDRWPNYSGTVWYKATWNFQCEAPQNQPMMLAVSFINMAGQIYINDHLLWQNKSLEEPLSRNWNMPKRWILPVGILKPGENTVLIRVEGISELNPGIGHMHLGAYDAVLAKFERYWLEMRGLLTYTLCLEVALGVIAGFVWLFRRKENAFGLYSLATLFWVIYIAATLMVEPWDGLKTLDFARVQSFVFLMFAWLTCLYTWRFANFKQPMLERVLVWVCAVSTLLLLFMPDAYVGMLLESSFVIALSIYLINCIVYPVIAIRSKQPEAYCLAFVLFFVYLPLSVHDGINIFQREGELWFVYATPCTTAILAFIFALRFTRSMNGAERFNLRLEHTVEQVRTELSNSLNTSHELALNNVKLQERIQLAHDLHDSLGGSLVRSMALVEQSRSDLSNRQFLSMLKHLRDDLRLIIDSGSSLDTCVPDTPMLWAAPTRYRFNQLFDELEVAIQWKIPKSWQGCITAAECISLQRVLDECLTNVLKHSQARRVDVCMTVENEELVIVVEDDGIGFDVNAVYDSGLSVGLRSMNARLKKMNAVLEVHSQVGCTRITIRKYNHKF